MDFTAINQELKEKSPQEILQWLSTQNQKVVITTNFGPHSAAVLHMTSEIMPDIPVIWVDSGYNTDETLAFAEALTKKLNLNLHIYRPQVSKAEREANGGIPSIHDKEAHDAFTDEVKLGPMQEAMDHFQPDFWITGGLRKDQTEFRRSLDIVIPGDNGITKVAPVFYWSELDMEEYLVTHDLPIEENYFDPTKVLEDRECGLHTRLA